MNPQKSPYPDDNHYYAWDWDNDAYFYTTPEYKDTWNNLHRRHWKLCSILAVTLAEAVEIMSFANMRSDINETEEIKGYLDSPDTEGLVFFTPDKRPIAVNLINPNLGSMVTSHGNFQEPIDWE